MRSKQFGFCLYVPETDISYHMINYQRCPGASQVALVVRNHLTMQETWVGSLGREDLLEEGMATHSSTVAWRIP